MTRFGLGHADTVPGGVNGRTGLKHMVAGGEGIPVSLLALEIGMTKVFGVLEEHPKRLGELVVLLNQGLIVDLLQERRSGLVLGRSGNEKSPGFVVEPLLIGQHPVPDVSAAAEGLFKQLRLFRSGIEADPEGGELRRLTGTLALTLSHRHTAGTPFLRFRESVLFWNENFIEKIFGKVLSSQGVVPNKKL